MATTAAALICPQGHGPGVPGTRFCTMCGSQLVEAVAGPVIAAPGASAPGVAAAPAAGVDAGQGGWAPVMTGAAPQAAAVATNPVAGVPVAASASPMPMPVAAGATSAVAAQASMPATAAGTLPACKTCGGAGVNLGADAVICTDCGWLRPLLPGYQLDKSIFLWAQDGQAMTKLQSLPGLGTVVKMVSDKVGRPWIESTFNGIRLGPRQLPDIWHQAVLAARLLGLPKMPDVYVAGDQMWTTYTYGTETSSFIVLGTAMLYYFVGDELLFVLAREMGHCRAGHALWQTVTRFIAGDVSVHSGLLSDGLLNALHPTRLIQGALDLPLMAWARQKEVTADRAGLLAVGDEALARRVLLAWSVRSARLLQQINIEEWMKQEDASNDQMTRLSEATTSSTMYTTRRLRLLGEAARDANLMRWATSIQPIRKQLTPVAQSGSLGVGTVKVAKAPPATAAKPAASVGAGAGSKPGPGAVSGPVPADSIRVFCSKCKAAVNIPKTVLRGKTSLNVRCPQCKIVFTIRPKGQAPAGTGGGAAAVGGKPIVQAEGAQAQAPATKNAGAPAAHSAAQAKPAAVVPTPAKPANSATGTRSTAGTVPLKAVKK